MNKDWILKESVARGDELHINLWYPDVPENQIRKIVVGLVDVRAADDIRISYDKERDGWKIEQASTFEWDGADEKCDPDWQEVAFVRAWAREKKSNPLLVPTCYQLEIWQVEKNVIYASIPAVEAGLEYAKELLAAHDRDLGRTTLKNKTWAETIEDGIRHMTRTLEMLRACGTTQK
jgi:hypothetical protein